MNMLMTKEQIQKRKQEQIIEGCKMGKNDGIIDEKAKRTTK